MKVAKVARSRQKMVVVFKTQSFDLNTARSQPENIIKMFVSFIVDVVDPPKPKSKHPVMSPTLEKALSKIEKGAEEWLEALWCRKEQVEEGKPSVEQVPKLIGHIEKVQEDLEDQLEDDEAAVEKEIGGSLMANKARLQQKRQVTRIRNELMKWHSQQKKMRQKVQRRKMIWRKGLEVQVGNYGVPLPSPG